MESQDPTHPSNPSHESVYSVHPEAAPPGAPKKNWFGRHMVLGYVFLFVVLAAIVAGVYYWQTVRQIPPTAALPVHKAIVDPTADWKTYTNTQYGFEFKYPNDVFAYDIADHSNGQVPVVAGFSRSALNQYDAGNPPPADKAGVANIFVWPSVSQDLKTWVTSHESGIKDWTETQISGTAALVNYRKVSSADITSRTFKTYYVKFSDKIIEIDGSSITNQFSEDWILQFDKVVATFKFTAPTTSAVDNSTLKTYTNAQYGFEFKYPATLQMEIMEPSPLFVAILKPVSESKSCLDLQNLASAVCIFSVSVGNGTGNLSKLGNPSTLTVGGKQATSILEANEQLISIPFSANNYLTISYDNKFKNSANDQILNDILNSFKFTK